MMTGFISFAKRWIPASEIRTTSGRCCLAGELEFVAVFNNVLYVFIIFVGKFAVQYRSFKNKMRCLLAGLFSTVLSLKPPWCLAGQGQLILEVPSQSPG